MCRSEWVIPEQEMDELGERGSTQRTLGRKSSESLVKLPLEPQVQKVMKSDQAHYLHSPAPSCRQVPLLSSGLSPHS